MEGEGLGERENDGRATQTAGVLIGASVMPAFLMGCVTRSLYWNTTYTETVSSVLISQDGKHLVVIGKNYHYNFDVPKAIVKTLQSPFHRSVSASFKSFHVDTSGFTSGDIKLTVDWPAPEEDELAALAAGYQKNRFGERGYSIGYSAYLTGRRFDAGGIQLGTLQN